MPKTIKRELLQETVSERIIKKTNMLDSWAPHMQFAIAEHKDVMGQVDARARKTEGRCDTLERQVKTSH